MEVVKNANAEPTWVGKMSVKALGCKPKKVSDENPKIALCQIFGKADGVKVGEDASGKVWEALTGSFGGINLESGEEFRSGKLFLPPGIHEVIESAVKQLGENPDGLAVKFAIEIYVVVASNPIGYSYQAKNLIKAETTDELTEIRKALADAAEDRKAIAPPAPASAQKQVVAPVAEKPKTVKK